jgi:cytochrome c peroxidase
MPSEVRLRLLWAVLAAVALVVPVDAAPQHHRTSGDALRGAFVEPISPVPAAPALDPQRIALGARLFQDPRLSSNSTRSCATCHPLDRGGMDGMKRALSLSGRPELRNTPTIFNVALSASFNWDGVVNGLEAHAEMVLLSPNLMGTTWSALLAYARSDARYLNAFRAAYGNQPTRETVLDALATFERSLLTPDSRFDRYLRGDATALSAREKHGYELFKSYGCTACHQGINIGGNLYQKFGIFELPRSDPGQTIDPGRYRITKVPRDREVFRVPSLRNVALTAPYFHDGRARTLEAAVETMAKVQLGRTLSQPDIDAIVSFLRTLTGSYHGKALDDGTP